MNAPHPLLIEPQELQGRLGEPNLLVADLSRADIHARYHIEGAVFLDYGKIVAAKPPTGGLLPDEAQLSRVLSAIGLAPEDHVVAYDDEGGGKAARLLWTLEALGHTRYSLLNGGLHAWANERHPLTAEPTRSKSSSYQARFRPDRQNVAVDRQFILDHLGDVDVVLLDARSEEEYRGEQLYSARGGHIPGAVNIEWTQLMDSGRNLRLLAEEDIRTLLEHKGIPLGKTVVAYCQTHHRSAHTWFVLKLLGYDARGYEGSWSEWGNRRETPVEV